MCKSEFDKDMERFKIALETRNFEIELFWKRCNYFLVLNTALAVGVFASFDKGSVFLSWIFFMVICLAGIFVCTAWIKVGLGSKYWQSHWEEVVIQEQESIGFRESESRDYFSIKGTRRRVAANLKMLSEADTKSEEMRFLEFIWKMFRLSFAFIRGGEQDKYKKLVLSKPSVSNWMHRTAVFFLLVWLLMLLSGIGGAFILLFCKFS